MRDRQGYRAVIFPLFPQWLPEPFEIVTADGRRELVDGNSYGGLGVHVTDDLAWQITHLNSGHSVRQVIGLDDLRLFLVATDLAERADWSFSGLEGWQNVQPDLPDIMAAWHRRWQLDAMEAGGGLHDAAAREIALKRLS